MNSLRSCAKMAVINAYSEDGMSISKVRGYFAAYGKEKDILEFDVSSATVELAAIAVGVMPKDREDPLVQGRGRAARWS